MTTDEGKLVSVDLWSGLMAGSAQRAKDQLWAEQCFRILGDQANSMRGPDLKPLPWWEAWEDPDPLADLWKEPGRGK